MICKKGEGISEDPLPQRDHIDISVQSRKPMIDDQGTLRKSQGIEKDFNWINLRAIEKKAKSTTRYRHVSVPFQHLSKM